MSEKPSKEAVQSALNELDELCRSEYGSGLEQIAQDKDASKAAAKLERITGIALKRKFAQREKRHGVSYTGAEYAWPWTAVDPEKVPSARSEFELLDALRSQGPWNRDPAIGGKTSWAQFKQDVDRERSLFKVLALYVGDKLKKRDAKSFREYIDAPESRRFEAGLDLATLVIDSAILSPILALVHVPTVAVGIALVGIQFGYRWLKDGPDDGGDSTK